MAYQLGDIVTTVQKRVRDTKYDPSEITQYLNDTQNDIFNAYSLPFMEATQDYTTVANNSDITNGTGLPTNYSQAIDLLDMTNGGERRITYKSQTQIDSFYANPENNSLTGRPIHWYYYAQTIRLYPVPVSVYSLLLRYYKIPTLLVADTDVPSIPSNFQEVLVLGAAYHVQEVKDNYDQAAILEKRYNKQLLQLVVRSSVPQTAEPIIIPSNRVPARRPHF